MQTGERLEQAPLKMHIIYIYNKMQVKYCFKRAVI